MIIRYVVVADYIHKYLIWIYQVSDKTSVTAFYAIELLGLVYVNNEYLNINRNK